MTTTIESPCTSLVKYRSPDDLGPRIPETKLETLFALLRGGYPLTASCRIAHTSSFSVRLKTEMDPDFAEKLAEAEAAGRRMRAERLAAAKAETKRARDKRKVIEKSRRRYLKAIANNHWLLRREQVVEVVGENGGTVFKSRRNAEYSGRMWIRRDAAGNRIGCSYPERHELT
jgi:hypothetical protein